jgi:hypothetical protein
MGAQGLRFGGLEGEMSTHSVLQMSCNSMPLWQ